MRAKRGSQSPEVEPTEDSARVCPASCFRFVIGLPFFTQMPAVYVDSWPFDCAYEASGTALACCEAKTKPAGPNSPMSSLPFFIARISATLDSAIWRLILQP